jgi:hypothetical protein
LKKKKFFIILVFNYFRAKASWQDSEEDISLPQQKLAAGPVAFEQIPTRKSIYSSKL